jgi:hypothetical protein
MALTTLALHEPAFVTRGTTDPVQGAVNRHTARALARRGLAVIRDGHGNRKTVVLTDAGHRFVDESTEL